MILKQGTGKIKDIVPGKTVATEMINTCGKRNAATRTTGGSNINKVSKAVGTKKRRPGRCQSPLTAQTQRGEKQIL